MRLRGTGDKPQAFAQAAFSNPYMVQAQQPSVSYYQQPAAQPFGQVFEPVNGYYDGAAASPYSSFGSSYY
jgi:hypothetical protein